MKKNRTSLFLDRSEIKKLLLESSLIVFSVLLALFINRTAENIKTQNQKQTALERIYKEAHKNKAVTQEWQVRHQLYFDKISKIVSDKNDSLRILLLKKNYLDIDLITEGKGMTSSMMASRAWDAAKSTQIISEFDYNTVESLTQLYLSQAITLDVYNRMMQLLFDKSVYDNEREFQELMLKLRLYMGELLVQEKGLNEEHYKNALKVLKPYATTEPQH
jgi:hypothetical protein